MTLLKTGGSSSWITGMGSEPVASVPQDDPSPEGMGTVHASTIVGSSAMREGADSRSNGAMLAIESAPGQLVRSQEATPA